MTSRPDPLIGDTRADTAAPTSEPEADDRISMLTYGASGVGKTAFAGTAEDDPRTAPVLYLDFENGAKTISWRNRAIRVMTADEIGGDLIEILTAVREGRAKHKATGKPFKCVVLDSITEAGASIEEALRKRDHGRPKGSTEGKLEYEEWTEYTNLVRDILRNWRQTPVSLIVTAAESQDTRKQYLPDLLGGRARNSLGQFFDTVVRMSVDRIETATGEGAALRRIRFRGEGICLAKDRDDPFSLLEPTLNNPTVTQVLDRCARGLELARARAYGDNNS